VAVDSIGTITFSNSVIQSDTRGGNPAGKIAITSPGAITFTNSQITSNTSGSGDAGDITLNAPIINVTANSQIRAETTKESRGQGGSITLNAPAAVALTRIADGIPVISVETSGAGQAGNITINTPQITLSDAATITATATQYAPPQSRGGNVTLNVSHLDLNGGTVGVLADTNGKAPDGNLTLNPYKGQTTLNITFTPNSFISAKTSSSGKGGDIFLVAPQSITLDGPGRVSVEATGSGAAGNIFITTQNLTLDHHVLLTASSTTGNGGNITIDPDILLLRRNSAITTSSGTQGAGNGNGGNIRIDSTFIVGAPNENSDIFANAFGGKGGVVTINASNLYWIDSLTRAELVSRLAILGITDPNSPKFSPQSLSTNDITAISQTNPRLNGSVTINALNLDVTQGLGELNLIPVDSSNLVAQSCATGKRQTVNENRFASTGRSGIPASPDDVFRNSSVLTELGTPTTTEPLANSPSTPTPAASTSSRAIVEAQELIIAPNGKARLVAQSSNATPASFQQPRITCPNGSSSQRP